MGRWADPFHYSGSSLNFQLLNPLCPRVRFWKLTQLCFTPTLPFKLSNCLRANIAGGDFCIFCTFPVPWFIWLLILLLTGLLGKKLKTEGRAASSSQFAWDCLGLKTEKPCIPASLWSWTNRDG